MTQFRSRNLDVLPENLAQTEGAEAADAGRARNSNPYSTTGKETLRLEWFRGYDRFLADLAGPPSKRSRL
jgi:hypothetical protein